MQRLRVAQYIFSFNVELCGDFLVAWTSAPPNSAAPVFQAARGYEAYRINTPAQVVSGARSGMGGAIRVRIICIESVSVQNKSCGGYGGLLRVAASSNFSLQRTHYGGLSPPP